MMPAITPASMAKTPEVLHTGVAVSVKKSSAAPLHMQRVDSGKLALCAKVSQD